MVAALWFTIDVSIMANKQHAQSRLCPIESHCIRPSSPFSIVYGHHGAAVPDDECCQGPQWSTNCSRSVFVTASLLPQPLVRCLHVGSRISMRQHKECIRWHQLELRNLASWLTLQGWHTQKRAQLWLLKDVSNFVFAFKHFQFLSKYFHRRSL